MPDKLPIAKFDGRTVSERGPKPVGEITGDLTFQNAESIAAREGLESYFQWMSIQERRFDRGIPAWFYVETECRSRYVEHIREALRFRLKQAETAGGE